MSAPRQRRWTCPRCGAGKLAPSKPRRDDVRRYCLACSEATGRLVERTCAALEAKRVESAEQRAARAKARRAAEARRRAEQRERVAAHLSYWSPLTGRIEDARRDVVKVWKVARRIEPGLRAQPPEIVASRGHASYAYTSRAEIHLCRGSDWHTLVHEVAHFVQAERGLARRSDGKRAVHDRAFYRILRDLVEKLVPGLTVSFAQVSRWGYGVDAIIARQVMAACEARAAGR